VDELSRQDELQDGVVDAQWLEMIDACRPGRSDHLLADLKPLAEAMAGDPKLADCFDRIQQFDAAIVDSIDDVPLPAGLAQRVLASLEAASADLPVMVPYLPAAPAAAPAKRSNRRTWLVSGVAAVVACAASLLIGFCFWEPATTDVGMEEIAEAARLLHEQDHDAWGRLVEDIPAPANFPLGPYLAVSPRSPWRALKRTFLGREGIAYELTAPRQVRATLFVLSAAGSLTAPQLQPLPAMPIDGMQNTAGRTTATWSDGTRLYVLVVDGDPTDLRTLVRQAGAMA
jgi:hypothetical protein